MTWRALHIFQTIRRDPADVAAFAGDPANLPRWAAGLSTGIRRDLTDDDFARDADMVRADLERLRSILET